jgi:putative methionine-R-sulfoxide reductase with GAF domain
VRQKVHTPAYASLIGYSNDKLLDLSKIIDINEDGMAIQASFPLHIQRDVNLCLDLAATKTRINTPGEVVWADGTGRVGISFPKMPDDAVRQLKEWLFVNLMVACVNYQADRVTDQLYSNQLISQVSSEQSPHIATRAPAEKPTENSALVNWMRQELEPAAPADYTSILTALAAVKREVDSLGSDLDSTLQLLAQRAQTFTRATGAAIALTEGASMTCRASSGPDAPGLGARLTTGSGFSGECVRTGQLLRCEDSETDPVADRESCRALGIRSMIAVPVLWGDAVIGLLEVFSPEPYAFGTNDPVVLKRLAGIISNAIYRAGTEDKTEPLDRQQNHVKTAVATSGPPASSPAMVDDEFPHETSADLPFLHFSRARKVLVAAAASAAICAGLWLISPADFAKIAGTSSSAALPPVKAGSRAPMPVAAVAGGLQGLRKLAEQGDATAQFSVGAAYATGDDVPQDYAEAVRWFSMAAEQGHVVSQATLGAYYWAGRGVPQDQVKAYFWSVLAQAGGDEASKYRVSVLASRMTRAQVAAAQQQANDWIKEHQVLSQNSPARP